MWAQPGASTHTSALLSCKWHCTECHYEACPLGIVAHCSDQLNSAVEAISHDSTFLSLTEVLIPWMSSSWWELDNISYVRKHKKQNSWFWRIRCSMMIKCANASLDPPYRKGWMIDCTEQVCEHAQICAYITMPTIYLKNLKVMFDKNSYY